MNNIFELLDIIEKLGGYASADELSREYCKKYKMVNFPSYSHTIGATLNANSNYVSFDSSTGKWHINAAIDNNEKKLIADGGSLVEHKKRTESILKNISKDLNNVNIITNNKVDTIVNVDDKKAFDIYYRMNEVRINVKSDGYYFKLSKELESSQLAYQKDSANPYSAKGEYAFFVSDNNEEYVYRYLLNISK